MKLGWRIRGREMGPINAQCIVLAHAYTHSRTHSYPKKIIMHTAKRARGEKTALADAARRENKRDLLKNDKLCCVSFRSLRVNANPKETDSFCAQTLISYGTNCISINENCTVQWMWQMTVLEYTFTCKLDSAEVKVIWIMFYSCSARC